MSRDILERLFGLEGRVAVVTGGSGVLGGAMGRGLAAAGARVGIIGRRPGPVEETVAAIVAAGGEAVGLPADVLEPEQLSRARDAVLGRWGRLDILVNAAGGNVAGATLAPGQSVFELAPAAFREVVDLNLFGSLLPSQIFGAVMAETGQGCIVNISSMAAARTITRVAGYSAAKAAIDNLTRWLATELARTYGEGLRVNAIAPGFFIGDQNRALLTDESGGLTERGRAIVAHTPSGRFGLPDELVSTLIWLCGPGARFVNGVVIPVDGGFSAFSGV